MPQINAYPAGGAPSGAETHLVVQAGLAVNLTTSNLGVLPGVAGAVARTFASLFTDTMSVRSFGVVGDGVTDDTVAFQRALDACAGKFNLLVNNGLTCLVSGLIYHSNSVIQIEGKVLLKAGSNTHVFLGDNAGVHNVLFRGAGVIDGNLAGNTGPATLPNPYAGGIVTAGYSAAYPTLINSNVSVVGLTIQNTCNWPVSIFACDGALVQSCKLLNSGNAPQFANGSRNWRAVGNTVKGNPDFGFAAYFGACRGEIASNFFEQVGAVGVLNDGAGAPGTWSGTPCRDVKIHHNHILDSYSYAVIVNNATGQATADHDNIDVYSNTLINSGIANTGNTAGGVMVFGAKRVRVRHNTIRGGGTAGYLWFGVGGGAPADRCKVEHNEISNGGAIDNGDGTWTALAGATAVGLAPFATNTRYASNDVFDDQVAPTMQFGFGYGQAGDVILAGCEWYLNKTAGMAVQAFRASVPFLPDSIVFSPAQELTHTVTGALQVSAQIHANSAVIDGTATVGDVEAASIHTQSLTATTETISATATIGVANITTLAANDASIGHNLELPGVQVSPSCASDTAAATAGVVVQQVYRDGSTLAVRVA